MSMRDPQVTLRQMLELIDELDHLVVGRAYSDLVNDAPFRRAVERLVEVLGEAACRLPEDLRTSHPEVPWRQIIGTRNYLAHGYDSVDYQVVWDAVQHEIAPLRTQIQRLLSS
jgi:uncharacterized protein with HEPN domain